MTRQPAIQVRPQLPVAGDTEAHLELDRLQAIFGFHISVAFDTIEPGPLNVGDMVEIDEIGNPEDAHPGDRLLPVEMLLLFQNLGVLWNDIFMAEETFFHRRNSRVRRPLDEGMAEPAVDLFDSGVHSMAEIDGLLRANVCFGVESIQIEHDPHQQSYHSRPDDPLPSVSRLSVLFSHPMLRRFEGLPGAPADRPRGSAVLSAKTSGYIPPSLLGIRL